MYSMIAAIRCMKELPSENLRNVASARLSSNEPDVQLTFSLLVTLTNLS